MWNTFISPLFTSANKQFLSPLLTLTSYKLFMQRTNKTTSSRCDGGLVTEPIVLLWHYFTSTCQTRMLHRIWWSWKGIRKEAILHICLMKITGGMSHKRRFERGTFQTWSMRSTNCVRYKRCDWQFGVLNNIQTRFVAKSGMQTVWGKNEQSLWA
jgi:hypothetical protein